MSTAASDRSHGHRALVLGGGGSAGNAWLIGVAAGLFSGGVDVTEADLIIGTSAGSTAAAQLTSASAPELFAAVLSAVPPPQTRPAGSDASRRAVPPPQTRPAGSDASRRPGPSVDHLERTGRIIAAAQDAADMRRRMGAAALELDAASDGSGQARWRTIVAARLPDHSWPERTLLITAVDAHTGEPVVFDRNSGVDLVDAVAASTSSAAAYGIGERRYIDGGYRRNENADLAAGYDRVLVLSPFGGRSRHPLAWGMQLAAQVDELCAEGSDVETVLPDAHALNAFGVDMMDQSARAPAARAGHDQGRVLAGHLGEFWH